MSVSAKAPLLVAWIVFIVTPFLAMAQLPTHNVLRPAVAFAESPGTILVSGDFASTTALDDDAAPPPDVPAVSFSCGGGCSWDSACAVGWVTADYLHWWMKGDAAGVLVTSSPLGTPRPVAGVLGQPTTQILYGGDRIADGGRPGVRLGFGKYIGGTIDWAVGTELFWVGHDDDDFAAFSQGNLALARPFFNTDPNVNAEDAELVAFDDPDGFDVLDGLVSVDTHSSAFSVGTHLYHLWACRTMPDRGYRVHTFGGYRYFRLDESVRIAENLLVTEPGGAIAQGTTIDLFDQFDASNNFHGGEFGIKTHMYRGPWTLDLLAKLAVGGTLQKVRINGQNTVTVSAGGIPPFTSTGGLLAQPTNIGTWQDEQFALLPQLQLHLGVQLTPSTRARVGYTLLYLTEVARPGTSIDRNVDGRFLDPLAGPFTATNPAFGFDSTSIWMQGINIGLDTRW